MLLTMTDMTLCIMILFLYDVDNPKVQQSCVRECGWIYQQSGVREGVNSPTFVCKTGWVGFQQSYVREGKWVTNSRL